MFHYFHTPKNGTALIGLNPIMIGIVSNVKSRFQNLRWTKTVQQEANVKKRML